LAPRRADFSILIPAFNQSTALEQSLPFLVGNLLTAKFSFEILISDNASTDDTWRICKDWSKSTKEIKVFLQRTNLGFLGNIRFLANNSTGNFVIILGCGDLLSVSLLNAIMPLLIEGQPHSLVCGVGTHRSIDWGLEPVIEGPIKTTKLCMLSKNAPYQEAISGNIFGNGNGELSRQLARDFQTGDVWPHLEIQMEAYLDGETILRTEANLVSMMQDSKSWYNNQALSRSFYRRHLVLLLPNSFKSVGLLVKTLSLLTVGLWSLLLKRRPPRPQ
jgi:glycosyltransferase involved in cell wall biosynthesis